VYVPHSKQSSRGQRARGNYRHANQQNGSLDQSEYGGSKQPAAGSKYRGGRGQRAFGQRGDYYVRRNPHGSAYERDRTSFTHTADNYYSGHNVDVHSASFSASADAGGRHTYSNEAEFNEPLFRVRENVRGSRVSKNDRRYEERSQKRDVNSSRGARHAYRRGRGYRGASNYSVDDGFGMSSIRSSEPDGGSEASADADLHDVTEVGNSERRKFMPKTRVSNNEKLTPMDGNCAVYQSAATSHENIPDDRQFEHLHISTEANDKSSRRNNQATSDAKMKSTDPEFETQRGCLFFFH